MIAYLKGILAEKHPDHTIVEVHGIGYEVEISTQTFDRLPAAGEELTLLIHHHITDNDQRLFGFTSADEKELFELLTTVKGVGPKLGLTILSGLPAPQITAAIAGSDKSVLTNITGIGKKTAERMILELKEKVGDLAVGMETSSGSVSPGLREEATSALESLGFRKRDAEKAVSAAAGQNGSFEDVQQLVKKALALMDR